jgi:hypothetical protein
MDGPAAGRPVLSRWISATSSAWASYKARSVASSFLDGVVSGGHVRALRRGLAGHSSRQVAGLGREPFTSRPEGVDGARRHGSGQRGEGQGRLLVKPMPSPHRTRGRVSARRAASANSAWTRAAVARLTP